MENNSIIEKIRRLLALSKSNNVNEASAAAEAAQRLMTKYQIDELTLQAASGRKNEPIEQDVIYSSKVQSTWRAQVFFGLAVSNFCVGYTSFRERGGKTLQIVGTRSNIQIVQYMFKYLTREIDRIYALDVKRTGMSGRTTGNAFRLGAADAIKSRLVDTSKRIESSVGNDAIVLVNNERQRVRDAVVSQFGVHLSKGKRLDLNLKDIGAYHRGVEAGKNVNLSSGTGIGAGANNRTLGA